MIDLEESPILIKGPTVRVYALLRYNSGYEQVANGILQIAVDNLQDRSQSYIQVKNEKDQVVFRSRIQRKNNYQIQQQTILCWEDDAHTYHNLALSFMTREQCDSYWRTICSIIGKNYLEIYGKQELLLSTQQNLGSVLNQIKNCFGLVAYNIINDDDNKFMSALSAVFEQMKNKEDEMGIGMIIRIVKSIVGANQIKVIQALLSNKNFNFILQVYSAHLATKVNLKSLYEAKIFIKNYIPLPQTIKEKIVTVHRANFFKENILTDLAVQGRLQSILDNIAKDSSGQIILYMASEQFWQSLLTYTQDQYQRFIQKDNEDALQAFAIHSEVTNAEFESMKLQFMIEVLAKLTFSGGEKIKKEFIRILYSTKTFEFISQMIEKNYLQSIEVLTQIARLNPLKFLQELRQGFRNSTGSNLQRTIAKKYVNDSHFQEKVLDLLRVIIYTLIERKDLLDFFAGTFVIFVIEYSQNALKIVQVLNIILEDLQPPFTLVIYKIIIKHKIFEKIGKLLQSIVDNPLVIGQRLRVNRKLNKQTIILLSKILRVIINENSQDISKQKVKEKREKQKETEFQKRNVFFLRSEFYPNVTDSRPHHELPKYTQQQIEQIESMKKYTIKSGILGLCVGVLKQSIQQNSMLSSSILEIFKTIENKRYNSFTQYVQQNLSDDPHISTYFKNIFEIKKLDTRKTDTDSYQDKIRKENIELQERQDQEKYLLNNEDENYNNLTDQPGPVEDNGVQSSDTTQQRKKQQLEQLAALQAQIKSKAQHDLEQQQFPKRKKIKKNEDIQDDDAPLFLNIDIPQIQ